MSSKVNGTIHWYQMQRVEQEVADVLRRIRDVEVAEEFRRQKPERERRDELIKTLLKGVITRSALIQKLPNFLQENPTISEECVWKFLWNGESLKGISKIRDMEDAAYLASRAVDGVEEISWEAYEAALAEGRRIKQEKRRWEKDKPHDENAVRCLYPVLLDCGDSWFFALEDSFGRKLLQDIKEHLKQGNARVAMRMGAYVRALTPF